MALLPVHSGVDDLPVSHCRTVVASERSGVGQVSKFSTVVAVIDEVAAKPPPPPPARLALPVLLRIYLRVFSRDGGLLQMEDTSLARHPANAISNPIM